MLQNESPVGWATWRLAQGLQQGCAGCVQGINVTPPPPSKSFCQPGVQTAAQQRSSGTHEDGGLRTQRHFAEVAHELTPPSTAGARGGGAATDTALALARPKADACRGLVTGS
eukprot:gene24235-biopygen5898